MKLRIAKKILKRWQNGYKYCSATLNRASKKYKKYLIKNCIELNKQCEDIGIIYGPFIIRKKCPLVGNYEKHSKKINLNFQYNKIKYENYNK